MNATHLFSRLVPVAVAVGVSVGSLFPTGAIRAAAEVDFVSINTISVPVCGAQSLTLTGSATYSEGTQHLVVKLDGVELFDNHDEPGSWTTGSLSVAVGAHTIVATIYDHSDHNDAMSSASASFTIADCSTGTSTGSESNSSSDSGSGDDTDCCPGKDPEVAAAKTGKVKGISTSAKKYDVLKPLNSIFRQVYGRTPTFDEWSYWATRFLSEAKYKVKGQWRYDALLGAMQYQHNLGRSIGM